MEYFAEFIEGQKGKLFYLARKPQDHRVKFVVVFVQPFAEEANKSRHMMTQLARTVVSQGGMAVIYDHYGSGDSEGELELADLATWQQDLERVVSKLQIDTGVPVSLCALRTGAIIAFGLTKNALTELDFICLINPVLDGKQFVNQFFRLKLASGLSQPGTGKTTAADIRAELQETGVTEIAGYTFSEQLVTQLEHFNLAEYLAGLSEVEKLRVCWLELVSQPRDEVSPGSKKYIDLLNQKTQFLEQQVIHDQLFWSTQEITTAENLINFFNGYVYRGQE